MKMVRIILIILSLAGLFLCLVALFTGDNFLGLLGSLSAFLFCAFQLCLTHIRKMKKQHSEEAGS